MRKNMVVILVLLFAGLVTASAYDLTKGTTEHGTLTIKVDGNVAETANAGQTVTVIVQPDNGYITKNVIAKAYTGWENAQSRRVSASGSVDLVTIIPEGSVNEWSFTMPAANVEVSATYKHIIQTDWLQDIADMVYTGEEIKPAVTVKDGNTPLVEGTDFVVSYSNNIHAREATATGNAPTVTITVLDTSENFTGEISKTFNINKAAGIVKFSVETVTEYYGSAGYVLEADNNGDGTVTYSSDDESVATVDATTGSVKIKNTGTAIITATITEAEDGNYSYATKTASYKLVVPSYTLPVSVQSYIGTYDGKAHGITLTAFGSVTVAYGTTEGEYNLTECPTFTEAGSYTVYYKVSKNLYSTVTGSSTVTILPATLTSVELRSNNIYYNGEEQTIEIGVVKAGSLIVPSSGYNVLGNKQKEEGTYTVTVVGKGNYTGEVTTGFSITKRPPYPDLTIPTAKVLTYTGEAQELVGNGVVSGGTLLYSLDGNTYTETVPKGTEAGEYLVYYMVVADANHTDIAAEIIRVVISPKGGDEITVVVSEAGANEVPMITVKDGETVLTEDDYSLSFLDMNGESVNRDEMEMHPGNYVAVVTLKGNYSGTKEQTITVKQAVGIQMTTDEIRNGAWYTVDGRRLPSIPTKKGIYIHKGKKVRVS